MRVLMPLAFPIGCCDTTWSVIGHGDCRRAPGEKGWEPCALRARFSRQIKVIAIVSAGGANFIGIHAVAETPTVEPHVARR